MSDTDDTEELLLIPPDFFAVESDSSHSSNIGPYYNIVNNLIKQVDNLKNRITTIESNESFLSNSSDHIMESPHKMQSSVQGFRKYNSTDDIYFPSSTQSTPQKPLSKFKLSSLPASPNVDRTNTGRIFRQDRESNTTKTDSPGKVDDTLVKEDDRMLGEIDIFLSKVKTIQRLNTARNLEKDFDRYDASSDNKNVSDTSQVDVIRDQQQNSELKSIISKEPTYAKKTTWQCGDNLESVPNLNYGVRDLNYKHDDRLSNMYKSNLKQHVSKPESFDRRYQQNTQDPMNFTHDSISSFDKYPISDSSTDSSQITRYERQKQSRNDLMSSPLHHNALSILNVHKQLLENSAQKTDLKNKAKQPKSRSDNTIGVNLGKKLNLMSLADIWSNNSQVQLNQSQLSQKLQEEKLRRQHCENLIQELQNRNLELQEKLSVAIRVDNSKNEAICQFQDALEKILMKLERIDREKREYENEISKLKKKHVNEMEDATQKLVFYEKEVSKALSLAHGNEDKMNTMENKCSDLQNEIQTVEFKFKDLQDHYEKEIERNKHLSEILSHKEMEIIENKNTLNDARCEIARSRRTIEVCQTEVKTMKDEYSQLQSNLKHEKEQSAKLNDEKKSLVTELEGYQNQESELKAEISRVKKEMDNNKMELRHFYQGQVEILVQNKLKEFQCQLDQAQAGFKDDMKKREMSIAKTAATHIQQITEKYSLEIKLLEKKHQEETKLYQIQIMQHKQQADNLQTKLDQLQEKRLFIAKQLQKIMESQWSEAFRIIASGKSPTFSEEAAFSTIDQLNSLKTRSYSNVEEVLAQQQEDNFNIVKRHDRREENCFASGNNERVLQDALVSTDETPVSSRTKGNKFSENDIQKYIQLLLNKEPSNPVPEESVEDKGKEKCDNIDQSAWSHEREVINRMNSKGNQREEKYPKPPWK